MPLVSLDEKAAFLAQWQHTLAPHTVGYRIKLLSLLLSRKLQERMDPHGLTVFHWVVLCCLWAEDGLATSAIGDRLNQVGGTLTGVLDRMEERGLISRQRDPKDRRVWRIWLAPEGLRLREVLPPLVQGLAEEALQGFSKEEYERFSGLLDQMIENLG